MADSTLISVAKGIVSGGRAPIEMSGLAESATLAPGDIVQRGTNAGDWLEASADYTDNDAAAKNVPFGVAKEVPDIDIDTVFGADKSIVAVPLKSGSILRIQSIDNLNTAISKGDDLYLSDTTPGRFELLANVVTIGTPTNEQILTAFKNYLGKAFQDVAASANSVWAEVI